MSMLRLASMVAMLALVSSPARPAVAQTSSAEAPAIHQVRIEDPGHSPITLVIWTPARTEGETNAAQARLPLVIMSHGTGAGPTAHVDTAEALASAGFVVAAPMHPGDNFQDDTIVGKPRWMVDRTRHVSGVLDFMIDKWPERQRVASQKIGIFGFSAGATTALISAGGVPDLGLVSGHCSKTQEFVCRLMSSAAGAPKVDDWKHDLRIKAAVLAAPGLGFAFEPSGLAPIKIPVQLWAGSADQVVPYDTNAAVVRRLLPVETDFRFVENAAHLSFLAPCEPNIPSLICKDQPGFDRAAFHKDFNRSIVEFFKQHLLGSADGEK